LTTDPETEKQLDYKIEEIVAEAAQVNWVESLPWEIRQFPIQNQNGSGSCVAHHDGNSTGFYSR
jgi:hypothetical protein